MMSRTSFSDSEVAALRDGACVQNARPETPDTSRAQGSRKNPTDGSTERLCCSLAKVYKHI